MHFDDENHEPLTDRYGFMYDVSQYDVLLLLRATECGNTAPACLTGVKIADREEDNTWPEGDGDIDERITVVKGPCDCNGDGDASSIGNGQLHRSDNRNDSNSIKSTRRSRGVSPSSSKSKTRSSVPTRNSSHPSMANSNTSILSVTAVTPRHACAKTVRKLLDQLKEIHDDQQAIQRKEWDTFVKQRSKIKSSKQSLHLVSSGTGGAAAILGLGTADEDEELTHSEGLIGFAQLGLSANRDERKEFDRLVRSGIPLVYRSKVWLECSGALEMKEPGLFQDLLMHVEQNDGTASEIEKDVGRTMPLNIFFGGDGAGVDKLRRVLLAYSR
jgi:hypothetical protein